MADGDPDREEVFADGYDALLEDGRDDVDVSGVPSQATNQPVSDPAGQANPASSPYQLRNPATTQPPRNVSRDAFEMELTRTVASAPVGATPSLSGEHLNVMRQTGRTTRMAFLAARRVAAGNFVIIVFHNRHAAEHFRSEVWEKALIEVAAQNATTGQNQRALLDCPMLVTVSDPNFSWGPPASYCGLPHADVLVDHNAVEEEYREALHLAHLYDPPIRAMPAQCAHNGTVQTPTDGLEWCPRCGALLYRRRAYCPGMRIPRASEAETGPRNDQNDAQQFLEAVRMNRAQNTPTMRVVRVGPRTTGLPGLGSI